MTLRNRINAARNSIELTAGAWYVVAGFAQKGITFVSLPLFTALLSPDDFGTVAVFLGWMAVLQVFVTLQLHGSIYNAHFDFDADTFKRFAASILSLGCIVAAITLTVFLVVPEAWLIDVFALPRLLVLLLVIGAVSNLPIEIALNRWRIQYRYKWFNVTRIGTTLVSTALAILLILAISQFTTDVPRAFGQIFAIVAVNAIVGIWLGVRIMREGQTLADIKFWRYAAAICLPLIIHSLSGIALSRIDRLMIDQYVGREETGIYTLIYNFGEIVSVLWYATNSVWTTWFFSRIKGSDTAAIRSNSTRYAVIFGVVVCGLMVIGPTTIRLLTPPAYWAAIPILPLVMAGGYFVLLYSLYIGVESYYKHTRFIALATVVAAAINISLNMWLLPIFGYSAAAWTTLISYICLYLMHSYVVIFRLKRGGIFAFWTLTACGATVAAFAVLVYGLL